jgi:acyl-CoA synthetase (NDP forming)
MAVDRDRLHRTLTPRSVAVVGAKGPDFGWLENNRNFVGPLYSVQLDPNEITEIEKRGFTNYLKLEDVPEDIDLVICAVPRPIVPFIVSDSIKKNVGGMAIFSAGFAETGEEDAADLQDRIVQLANDAGMPIVGPNCMGVYNRRQGVKFSDGVDHGDGGTVSIMGQSGTHTIGATTMAQRVGIPVSRGISFGNAVVVNEADYMEYLRDDPDTEVIGVYLEGLKDGRRFFDALRSTTQKKPVVIWKGGQTAAGQRATRSHTASLATPMATWNALIEQTGAIPANSVDELVDALQVLVHASAPRGRRLALMAMTGGQSVAISDAFGRQGLEVPELADKTYETIGEFFNVIGGSFRNPFDMANTIGMAGDSGNLARIMGAVSEDPNIDAMVFEFSAGFFARMWKDQPERLEEMLDELDGFRERTGLPLVTVMHGGAIDEEVIPIRDQVVARGFAVLPSFDRAALALSRVIKYHEWVAEAGS